MVTLAQRLGFAADTRLLIVHCDDLGSTRSANVAIREAFDAGTATSASLMVPCPWARGVAAIFGGADVGVHLTLNAEWEAYRWGPLTPAPSLLASDGGLRRTVDDLWAHADLGEVRNECRAQIQRALEWGIDVTHLDSHMGPLQLRADYFAIYLELAREFALPLRMVGAGIERGFGFAGRELARAAGVVFPDHLLYADVGGRMAIERALAELRPGVTEVFLHPAVDTDELRASHPDWAGRVDDHAFLTSESGLRALVESTGVHLIGFRELRELQRGG